MKLAKLLRNEGYDYIEGIVRNHKPLQLWLKEGNDAQLFHVHIGKAFQGSMVLEEVESPALNVDFNEKNEYNFNIGITILENLLTSLGMGAIDFSTKFSKGKSIAIGFTDTVVKEYTIGDLNNYLVSADLSHPHPELLKQLNRDNILVISGVIYAKNLRVEMETTTSFSAELKAEIKELVNGKLSMEFKGDKKVVMTSDSLNYFPIAVKANCIDFDHGRFMDTRLITDTGNTF